MKGGDVMGWWKTVRGAVIGDPAADYIEELAREGRTWVEPAGIPAEVRKRLDALYVEGIGRAASDEDLEALLLFCG
jgi:hypothetical protein